MNQFKTLTLLGALVAGLAVGTQAQEQEKKAGETKGGDRPQRGNFNPDEFRQRMMERMKEQFEVTNDDEWKLISERIEKVSEARRSMGGGFGGMRPPGGGPSGGGEGGNRTRGGFAGFRAEPDPELDALRQALDAKASPEEIKGKLERLRASRKDKEAKLDKAQDELRAVLTQRQEAIAVMMGLLK